MTFVPIEKLTPQSGTLKTIHEINTSLNPEQLRIIVAHSIAQQVGIPLDELDYRIYLTFLPHGGLQASLAITREEAALDTDETVDDSYPVTANSWTIEETPDDYEEGSMYTGEVAEQILRTGEAPIEEIDLTEDEVVQNQDHLDSGPETVVIPPPAPMPQQPAPMGVDPAALALGAVLPPAYADPASLINGQQRDEN